MMRTAKSRFGAIVSSALFILILTAPVSATTLTITEGELFTGWFTMGDVFYSFRGAGFTVDGIAFGQWGGDFPASWSLALAGVPSVSAVVGGAVCEDVFFEFRSCGELTFTTPRPPTIDFTRDDTQSVPFTVTGHLDVGDGFDLVGRGVLEAIFCLDTCPQLPGEGGGLVTHYRFTQSVPEPATVMLLAAGLGAVIGLRRAWRL
jgi:PEP-CTERM motif